MDVKRPIELLIREKQGFHIESLHSSSHFLKTKPRRIAEVEIRHLRTRPSQPDSYLLKNTKNDRYLRMSARDMLLWNLLDGAHSVYDIAAAFFAEHGSFDFESIHTFLARLRDNSLLESQKLGVLREVSYRLGFLGRLLYFLVRTEYSFKNLDSILTTVYRRGVRLLFTWPALLLMVVLSLVGFFFFWKVVNTGEHSLFLVSESILLGLVFLLLVFVISTAVHESAHALTCKHYGRAVKRGGFLLDFGRPVFFADTTDIWMASKKARIATYLAGPFSSIVLAGAASMLAYFSPAAGLNSLLIKLAFFSYILGLFHLCPVVLLETDGYRVLMEFLGIPGLKSKSLGFLRKDLFIKMRRGSRLTKREVTLVIFAVVSVLTLSGIMSLTGRYIAYLIMK